MASLPSRILANLPVALAAVGVYHVGFATLPGASSSEGDGGTSQSSFSQAPAIETLARRADAVRADMEAAGGGGAPASRAGVRIASIERKVLAVERAPAVGRHTPPASSGGQKPRPWTPARIEALDAILDQLDARDLEAHEKERWPAMLEAFSPGLDPEVRSAATDLLATFFVRARGAFDSFGQGYVYDAGAAAVEAAIRARADALDALRTLVPEPLARRLDAELPRFPVDPKSIGRRPGGPPRSPRR